MNTNRRIFRGRGGPTDRRLPKQNARRRTAGPGASKPATNKYENKSGVGAVGIQASDIDMTCTDNGGGNFGATEAESFDDGGEETNIDDSVSMAELGDESNCLTEQSPQNKLSESTTLSTGSNDSACTKEVRHLRKRVANVQESIQLSAHSISNPKTYHDNVLNAASNCVNEWRSIVRQYSSIEEVFDGTGVEGDKSSNVEQTANSTERIPQEAPFPADEEKSSELLTVEQKKPAALAVFQLIQLAIQCGPLAGAKPGYFKRCGGAVAKIVVLFLDDVVPHQKLGNLMGFTDKQMAAMEQWQKNAKKAAAEDKAPSRTALKQQQGKGTGKKAKKKMKKK